MQAVERVSKQGAVHLMQRGQRMAMYFYDILGRTAVHPTDNRVPEFCLGDLVTQGPGGVCCA